MSQTEPLRRSRRDYLGLGLRGVCMGAADIVPGVSGGTMAFILGIYEELIESIRMLGQPRFLGALFRFRVREVFALLNWRFLFAVGFGILLAIATLARALTWLLKHQPVYLWSFFFGLVLASVLTVARRVDRWRASLFSTLTVSAVLAYLFVGLVPVTTPESWWFLVLAGALASCAMILPGISGSFVLLLLGKYLFVLSAINGFLDDRNLEDFTVLVWVALGVLIGLVSMAQALGWFFRRYHDLTVAALTGLMIGSLRRVWPWKTDLDWLRDSAGEYVLRHGDRTPTEQANVLPALSTGSEMVDMLIAVGLAVLGCGLILVLERWARSGKGS